jgi:hypothetical protein
MIAYAIDNPPPATIVLITAVQGYSYAVSILRLRRYRVVVIAPPGTTMTQASVQLDWNSEVLHAPLEELNPTNRSKPASCQRADSTPYSPSTSRTQYMADADDMVDNDMYGTYDKHRRGSTSYSTPVNGIGDPFKFSSQRYSEPPLGRQTPAAYPPTQAKTSPPATFQSAKSIPPSPPIAYKTPEPVFVTEGHGLFESSTRTPNLPKRFPYSEPESRTGSKQPSFPNISPTESSSSSIFQPPSISPSAASKAYEPAKTPPPIPPVPKSASDTSMPTVASAPPVTPQVPLSKPVLGTSAPASSSVPKGTLGPTSQTTEQTNQGSSNNTQPQPTYFVKLAERLQARRQALGQPYIPRTDIGSELAKHKSVYAQAGVSTFAAFINLAHTAGVVDVGGSGNDQWVSLRPKWAGAA